MNPKFNWLRWIGILPLSILAYLAAYALFKLAGMFPFFEKYSWLDELGHSVAAAGLAGYYFVKVGTYTAPYKKKAISLVLWIILMALLLLNTALLISRGHFSKSIIETTFNVIGGMIAFWEVKKETLLQK